MNKNKIVLVLLLYTSALSSFSSSLGPMSSISDKIKNLCSSSSSEKPATSSSAESKADKETIGKLRKNDISAASKTRDFTQKLSELFSFMHLDLLTLKRRQKKSYEEMVALEKKIEYGGGLLEQFSKMFTEEQRKKGSTVYITNRIKNDSRGAEGNFDVFPSPPPPLTPIKTTIPSKRQKCSRSKTPPKRSTRSTRVSTRASTRAAKHKSLGKRKAEAEVEVFRDIIGQDGKLDPVSTLDYYIESTSKNILLNSLISSKLLPVSSAKFKDMLKHYKLYLESDDDAERSKLESKFMYWEKPPIEAIEEYLKSNRKTDLLNRWVDNGEIPVKSSKFHEMVRDYRRYHESSDPKEKEDLEPKFTSYDIKKGPKAFFQLNDISTLTKQNMRSNNFNVKGLAKDLNEAKKQEFVKRGWAKELVPDISERTLRNYKSLIVRHRKFNYQESVCYKSDSRNTAEHSILSTLTYLMTIATTHFQLCSSESEGKRMNEKFGKIDEASAGAQLFHELVSSCNEGLTISPIDPALIFSTDDTTVYAFDGRREIKEQWFIIEDGSPTNVRSVNSCDKSHGANLNGIRVRLTFTMNATGQLAPVFITVYNLSDKEVLETDEDGLCIVEIPGLSVCSTDGNNTGYISFLKSAKNKDDEKTMDQKNFEWYRKHIFIPWVESLREKITESDIDDAYFDEISSVGSEGNEDDDDLANQSNATKSTAESHVDQTSPAPLTESNEEDRVPLAQTAISWFDGGISQLKAIKTTVQQKIEAGLRIISNKHSRGRSAMEQPCDICPAFRTIKKMLLRLCSKDFPNSIQKRFLRGVFFKMFKQKKVVLTEKKFNALISLCITLPVILAKGVNESAVQKGFFGSGMIDKDSATWPDLFKILETCNNEQILQNSMLQKIVRDFPVMYEEQIKHGQISDEFLIELGYPKDTDQNGDVVERNTTMVAEWNHRAKTISHEHQVRLREQMIKERDRKKQENEAKFEEKRKKLVADNKKAESILMGLVDDDVEKTSDVVFGTLTLEQFDRRNLTKELLKGFIFVRQYDHVGTSTKTCQLNKGKFNDPPEIRNLIKVAFELRLEKVLLKERETQSPEAPVEEVVIPSNAPPVPTEVNPDP